MGSLITSLKQIRAGNTVEFTVTDSDYPASDYTGKARIVGNGGVSDEITGVADGDDYVFTFSSTQTGTLTEGTYKLHAYAESGSERYDLLEQVLTVLPNVSDQTVARDSRSFAQKMVDELEATLLKLTTDPNASVSMGTRSYTRYDIQELNTLLIKYKKQVSAESGSFCRTVLVSLS